MAFDARARQGSQEYAKATLKLFKSPTLSERKIKNELHQQKVNLTKHLVTLGEDHMREKARRQKNTQLLQAIDA